MASFNREFEKLNYSDFHSFVDKEQRLIEAESVDTQKETTRKIVSASSVKMGVGSRSESHQSLTSKPQKSRHALNVDAITPTGLLQFSGELRDLLKSYYEYLETQPNSSSSIIQNLIDIRDPDKVSTTTQTEISKFFYEFATEFVQQNLHIDEATFIKYAKQFYAGKGSATSFREFFKVFFGETSIRVYFPWDHTLRCSDNVWNDTGFGFALDNEGSSLNVITVEKGSFKEGATGGLLSDINHLQDSFFYQRFSYEIVSQIPEEKWLGLFLKTMHPAGFKLFPTLYILLFGGLDILGNLGAEVSEFTKCIPILTSMAREWKKTVFTKTITKPGYTQRINFLHDVLDSEYRARKYGDLLQKEIDSIYPIWLGLETEDGDYLQTSNEKDYLVHEYVDDIESYLDEQLFSSTVQQQFYTADDLIFTVRVGTYEDGLIDNNDENFTDANDEIFQPLISVFTDFCSNDTDPACTTFYTADDEIFQCYDDSVSPYIGEEIFVIENRTSLNQFQYEPIAIGYDFPYKLIYSDFVDVNGLSIHVADSDDIFQCKEFILEEPGVTPERLLTKEIRAKESIEFIRKPKEVPVTQLVISAAIDDMSFPEEARKFLVNVPEKMQLITADDEEFATTEWVFNISGPVLYSDELPSLLLRSLDGTLLVGSRYFESNFVDANGLVIQVADSNNIFHCKD